MLEGARLGGGGNGGPGAGQEEFGSWGAKPAREGLLEGAEGRRESGERALSSSSPPSPTPGGMEGVGASSSPPPSPQGRPPLAALARSEVSPAGTASQATSGPDGSPGLSRVFSGARGKGGDFRVPREEEEEEDAQSVCRLGEAGGRK